MCRLARMALDVQSLMEGYQAPDGGPLVVRVGLHTGETLGDVMGQHMLRYHMFGPPLDGVNRVEWRCDPGGVRGLERFAELLRRACAPRARWRWRTGRRA